jgi:hypothetical protein
MSHLNVFSREARKNLVFFGRFQAKNASNFHLHPPKVANWVDRNHCTVINEKKMNQSGVTYWRRAVTFFEPTSPATCCQSSTPSPN